MLSFDRRPPQRTVHCVRHAFTGQVRDGARPSCPYCDGQLGWGITGPYAQILDLWRWRMPRSHEVTELDDARPLAA